MNINFTVETTKNNIDSNIENSRTLGIILKDEKGQVYFGDNALLDINPNEKMEINSEFHINNIEKFIIIPEVSTWMKTEEQVSDELDEYAIEIDISNKR
ncbi:MAG: hypothetical protein ACRDB0_05685 [Paraclostridium sp.]